MPVNSFPKISFTSSMGKADVAVLGWFQEERDNDKNKKNGAPQFLGKRNKSVDELTALLKGTQHFGGRKAETSLLRFFGWAQIPNTLLLGLGSTKKWSSETARQCGAAVFLAQKRERLSSAVLLADSVFNQTSDKQLPLFLQAFCEGYLMAGHEYRALKKEDPNFFSPTSLEILGIKADAKVAAKATLLATAVNLARTLGDQPGNVLTPTEFAKGMEKMAKEYSLKVRVLGRGEMEKEKMGLLLGVAKGSIEEPKLIILEHRGGKKNDRPVALVGKGITFDSGGISLKPSNAMEDMKYDMMGAAAVAGMMQAVAALKLPLNVVGLIAAAENMPGGRAQKPGDVARSMSGKSVEIINTDAEGRLILADALEYVQKYYDPQVILDFATLTGAVVQALGTVTTGIMGTHRELIQRMKDSAEVTGERVWELPLYEEYEEDLKSPVADIKNSGTREAGSSKGGTFLKFFVDGKYPWVHCDIAGSAYHRKDVNYHPAKYGAGVMVRLMAHLLEEWKPLE